MTQLCKVCDHEFTGDMNGMILFNNNCGQNRHLGKLK